MTAESNQVWISERNIHRVSCVDETLSTIRTAFVGERGDDLAHCDRPGVYDLGNQRLLKLDPG